jgi:trk system potassium uptake protein TrkA
MHVIVVGCGRVGSEVARSLAIDGHQVVIIDRRAEAFRRLGDDFAGTKMVGVGFDRELLAAAGITEQSAVAAVTSGDNSNILIARVAKETFGASHVVARIYDPRRASIYERLGIATVATVQWTSERVLRHLLSAGTAPDWVDPSAKFTMVERRVPAEAAGSTIASLEAATCGKVALLHRFGDTSIPAPSTLLQEDDELHVIVAAGETELIDQHLGNPEGGH